MSDLLKKHAEILMLGASYDLWLDASNYIKCGLQMVDMAWSVNVNLRENLDGADLTIGQAQKLDLVYIYDKYRAPKKQILALCEDVAVAVHFHRDKPWIAWQSGLELDALCKRLYVKAAGLRPIPIILEERWLWRRSLESQ
jgi:hypothetical protein